VPSTRRPRRQPELQIEFFVDRSLGRKRIPGALKEMGFVVHTLFDVYGKDAEQGTKDPEWIKDCGTRGWVALCRDKLRHPGERTTIERYGTRVFSIGRSARNADRQIDYLRANINRIVKQARKPGPYIYRVDRDRIERLWP
jgi:hypothetical protein